MYNIWSCITSTRKLAHIAGHDILATSKSVEKSSKPSSSPKSLSASSSPESRTANAKISSSYRSVIFFGNINFDF